ncbi:hypothetical protein HZB02_03430 [Candidatus Woesearchaeota archaeon]|nr:hypothetical protein [Candidatus Woesearchaeota archaeon]
MADQQWVPPGQAEHHRHQAWYVGPRKSFFFPLVLIAIGLYYLGKFYHWWDQVPFWPILLIFLGVWIFLRRLFQ